MIFDASGPCGTRVRPLTEAIAPWLLVGLLGTSCTATEGNLYKALALASYDFNTNVRWGRYQEAAAHLDPSLRNSFLTRTEDADDALNISMVEELRQELADKGRKAEMRYRYHWHRTKEGILRKTVVIEEWIWLGAAWRLVRLRHGSGTPFPLFDGLAPARRPARPAPPPQARPVTPVSP
jgi:hypothetical protein